MPYRLEINEKCVQDHPLSMGIKYLYLIEDSTYLLEIAFEAKSFCDTTKNAVYYKDMDSGVNNFIRAGRGYDNKYKRMTEIREALFRTG